MKCPVCGENTPDAWERFRVGVKRGSPGMDFGWQEELATTTDAQSEAEHRRLSLDWMRCANNGCTSLVVRAHEQYRDFSEAAPGAPYAWKTDTWIVRPRFATGWKIDELVPPEFRKDFHEAAAILATSPRMSAVLSRRILADLLERFGNQTAYGLNDRINGFIEDKAHPFELRKNLHYLREIGDFGAHTQTNDQMEVVNVGPEEAEWTLVIVSDLFDYFIVSPQRHGELRKSMDQKLEDAGRHPIKPLPDEDEES
jgi:hypothetical protein